MPDRNQPSLQIIGAVFLLAACYFLAGKFGLSIAVVNASASAVWPPSGLAFAALLIWGYRLWPGVFLGAFLVNISTQGSIATSVGIAFGNTAEALLGGWLVKEFAHGRNLFDRPGDILKFVLFGPVLSTLVAASFGLASLTLGGFAPQEKNILIWVTWWLGDMAGDLVIAPLLVIWFTHPLPRLVWKRILEAGALLTALVILGGVLFLKGIPSGMEYLATLAPVWAALRFDQRGAARAEFLVSA